MEKKQIIILGLIFFIFFHLTEADVCNDPTFIYGKVYFDNYCNSQVVNATIEVWNNNPDIPGSTLLLSTNTNTIGHYSMDISKNMTSIDQTFYVKAKRGNAEWDYKKVDISCGNPNRTDFVVVKICPSSPTKIVGAILNQDGSNAPEENTTVVLNFHPKGSGNFFITVRFNTTSDENSTSYNIGEVGNYIFYISNTHYSSYSWPIDMLVSMEPFNGHYYRYFNSGNPTKYLNTSITCGSSINNANFYAFDRKNATENCTYNDECLSNSCYNKKCASCMRGDANNDTLIDIFDVVKILEYLAYGTNIKKECADMNEDNFVNMLDTFALIQDL